MTQVLVSGSKRCFQIVVEGRLGCGDDDEVAEFDGSREQSAPPDVVAALTVATTCGPFKKNRKNSPDDHREGVERPR